MTTPKTFTSHGEIWTEHTPGDPMPCVAHENVFIITADYEPQEFAKWSCGWKWEKFPETPECEIIGWRYADNEQPKPVSAWRPIAEAPRDGRIVLLYQTHRDEKVFAGYYSIWDSDHGGWTTDRSDTPVSPTHFMPLPEPPEETENRKNIY